MGAGAELIRTRPAGTASAAMVAESMGEAPPINVCFSSSGARGLVPELVVFWSAMVLDFSLLLIMSRRWHSKAASASSCVA